MLIHAMRELVMRKAKIRTFELNEILYLFTPAIKPGQCKKFRKFWSGP